jgi:hypothetical protein
MSKPSYEGGKVASTSRIWASREISTSASSSSLSSHQLPILYEDGKTNLTMIWALDAPSLAVTYSVRRSHDTCRGWELIWEPGLDGPAWMFEPSSKNSSFGSTGGKLFGSGFSSGYGNYHQPRVNIPIIIFDGLYAHLMDHHCPAKGFHIDSSRAAYPARHQPP